MSEIRTSRIPKSILLAVLLALPVLAGSTQGIPVIAPDDAGTGMDAPDTPTPSFTIAAGVVHQGDVDTVTDPSDWYAVPVAAGDTLEFAILGQPLCASEIAGGSGAVITSACTIELSGTHRYTATLSSAGTVYLHVKALPLAHYFFSYQVNGAAPDPSPGSIPVPSVLPPPPPGPGTATACPGAPTAENDATSGAGDAAVPSLVWAALKTGFRAVVAFETALPTVGSITYDLSGGTSTTLLDRTPTTNHVFVLDGLPVGGLLCFEVDTDALVGGGASGAHALRLENAMNAYDSGAGAYSLNLLVLANEQLVQRGVVENGLDRFARLIWDATDGNVRVGRVILLYDHVEHHNSGWVSCYIAHSPVGLDTPTCNRVVDIIFTNDAYPTGAASTYADGIQDDDQAIWMNWYWQGTGLDDTGQVLAHEMGHYAFGAMDLYIGGSCYIASKRISIMGSSRAATEFDDPATPCPNAASIPGYVPTWTLLQARYPNVPARPGGPVFGPSGNGGAYVLTILDLT